MQQKGESIRSYIKRFNEVKIEVLQCEKSMVAMTFCKDLLSDNKLHHSLVKTRLMTIVEVLKHAQKYINIKEKLKA